MKNVRVSSVDQNADRQIIAMEQASIPKGNIFIDKQSDKDLDRPKYTCLPKELK